MFSTAAQQGQRVSSVTGTTRKPQPPDRAYAGIMGTFVGGLAVTCSRCIGTWSLAAGGVNDWLQAGFAVLTQGANELGHRTGE